MADEEKSSSKLADKLFPEIADDGGDILDIPPEKRRLNTETYDFNVSTISDYLTNSQIVIPEFQRGYVWNRVQAARLIESLIINCPIPVVFLSQNADETLSVIDGNQRLNSINLFLRDGFELQGLTAYPELNGYKFSDLDPRFQRHILNRTIRCIVITKDTHPQIKFDVFERLNTGSVKLNAQELRNGLHSGPLMKLLESLGSQKEFKDLTGNVRDKRMKSEELVLRYFALSANWEQYQKPMNNFLSAFSEENRNISVEQQKSLSSQFKSSVEQVQLLLGKFAFRTYDENQKNLKFNAALYDAQMVALQSLRLRSDFIKNTVNSKEFILRNHNFINTDEFSRLITAATTDRNSVIKRIRDYTDFLKRML